jgi:hypothetical protein
VQRVECRRPALSRLDAPIDRVDVERGSAGVGYRFSLSDTWIWNGSGWMQQNVTGPSARFSPAIGAL